MVPAQSQLPPDALQVHSPLKGQAWESALSDHPNRSWVDCLLSGIRHGVHIGFGGGIVRSAKTNLQSALANPAVVEAYLEKELQNGTISGPWTKGEVPSVILNRFGVIPKSGRPGKWRLIVDMSFPDGYSVNSGIDDNLSGMAYSSVVDAARMMLQFGKGALLAKIDVASAYRIVPVHPADRFLLGMSWKGKVYVDRQLPFGLSSAPAIFNAYADGLEWVVRKRGVAAILHYLDDFLVMGPAGSTGCQSALSTLSSTCAELGIPLAADKREGPSASLIFLGFVLDSQAMEIRLPPQKLSALVALLEEWVVRKSCTKKELEQLVGKLNHACMVVSQGRVFLRRLYDVLGSVKKSYFHLRLNLGCRSDLAWWSCFLPKSNGRSLAELTGSTRSSVVFASDASGYWGCGAVWGEKWLQGAWPLGWDDVSIMVKELCPIVCACAVWGPGWRGESVLCQCDNLAVVCAINSGSSRESSGAVMHLLRSLFFIVSFFGFSLKASHVAGKNNGPADAISRDDLPRFFLQVPSAVANPTPIPIRLWQLVVIDQPDWLSMKWRELFSDLWQQELLPPQQDLMQQVDGAMRSSARV